MELLGIIKAVLPIQQGVNRKGAAWQKQEIVVETQEQYPQSLVISAINEKIAEVDGLAAGTPVRVIYNASAREYNGRWYNSLSLYKALRQDGRKGQPAQPNEDFIDTPY